MNWQKEPLYKVERASVTDPTAATELARRFAADTTRSWHTGAHVVRIRAAWLKGFNGDPNPYSVRNNFAAPYKSAWRSGKAKRHELASALEGASF